MTLPKQEDVAMTKPIDLEPALEAAKEKPGELEFFEGRLQQVIDPSRNGWWRFNRHYDRDGYCDNPARGY